MFYMTRDAKTVRRMSRRLNTSNRYFDQEHFETNQKYLFRYKSYGSNSFHDFGDIDLDL